MALPPLPALEPLTVPGDAPRRSAQEAFMIAATAFIEAVVANPAAPVDLVLLGAGLAARSSFIKAAYVPPPPDPGFAWTELPPQPADARIIYVSSSTGSDLNGGLAPDKPVKTLKKAQTLDRKGFPDRILLKRGDVWTGESFVLQNGRSESERAVLSSYGSGDRPLFVNGSARPNSHAVITGLAFKRTSELGAAFSGIWAAAGTSNVLIEDCYVEGYGVNISMQGSAATGKASNLAIRGCVSVDSYSTTGHSQGLYVASTDGVLIEGCIFDHNGWNEDVVGGSSDDFSHNAYLQYSCSNVVTRNNISANGSAAGLQQRSGGLCEDNLFLRNPVNLVFGYSYYDAISSGTVRRNVCLDGRDFGPPGKIFPRGWGIWLTKLDGVEVCENIIAHQASGTGPRGITLGREFGNASIHDNIVYDWGIPGVSGQFPALQAGVIATGPVKLTGNHFQQSKGLAVLILAALDPLVTFSGNHPWSSMLAGFKVGSKVLTSKEWAALTGDVDFAQASFADPDRTIGSYVATLGLPPTFEAFMAEARKQSKDNWRTAFTAKAVGDYIRAGFVLKS